MGKVLAEMSVSLDGYVADPEDGVDMLHAWYGSGEVETPTGTDGIAFRTSPASARVLREELASSGALITGRRNFDIARGWDGQHPLGVPVFVVTHSQPAGWPREGAPFTFLDDVAAAIAAAQEVAGDKTVVIASPSIAQQALALGMLDEIALSLVPVLLGEGIPFFARHADAPTILSDPEVVQGQGVTHLRYRVKRAEHAQAGPESSWVSWRLLALEIKDGVHAERAHSRQADDASVFERGEGVRRADGPRVAGRDGDDARGDPSGR